MKEPIKEVRLYCSVSELIALYRCVTERIDANDNVLDIMKLSGCQEQLRGILDDLKTK